MSAIIPDSHLDLLAAQTAVLGTVDVQGRPQLTAIWFLAEGQTIKLSLSASRVKVRNLRERPALSFFVFDPTRANRYLEVRGDAVIEDDPDYAFADQVGAKYGVDLRMFDGDHRDRVVVTIQPVRVNTVDLA